jgi:hypothetical protein
MDQGEFHTDLMQLVASRALAQGELTRTVLVEELAQRLVEADVLQDWIPCHFEGKGYRGRRLAVDGYSTDELDLDGTMQVLVAEYRDGDEASGLALSEVKTAFARATNFVEDALAGRLMENLEPSTPAADFAKAIEVNKEKLKTLQVILLSNASTGTKQREIDRDTIKGVKIELQVWDLSHFHLVAESGGREDVDIDLTEYVPGGLAALPAGIGHTDYTAFLCAVPGPMLADIYDRYGSRLLEGNVRAFLSARGNVNKGIRLTIKDRPEHFFAFNNGITATASGIEMDTEGGLHRIRRVRDLQIVNGGQTTASLYNARQRDRMPLDHVFVQMKLSVLPPELAETMIPDISRFANTQNRVSDADLFANHPFHRKVEELSRRVWAPARSGSQQMTHWFYERARAQYQTEQFKLRPSEKREFLIRNPKDQVITKTDLAKFENTWRRLPHIVSFGAQKNFVKYAEVVRDEYDKRPADFNDRWFQHIGAKAILFRAMERLVSNAPWYTGGYRANIVTYGLARFVQLIEESFPGLVFDLDRIWKTQRVQDATKDQLTRCAWEAYQVLTSPPPNWANVTEWAKKEACWQKMATTEVELTPEMAEDVKPADDERSDQRAARSRDRVDDGLKAIQNVLLRTEDGFWRRALDSPISRRILSGVEYGLLQTAAHRVNWIATDSQARRLMAAAIKLEEEGLF